MQPDVSQEKFIGMFLLFGFLFPAEGPVQKYYSKNAVTLMQYNYLTYLGESMINKLLNVMVISG